MNSRTYLVDKTEKFDGYVQTSCTNGYADYQDEPITTADYIEKKKAEGIELIELTWEETAAKLEAYHNEKYINKPWQPITEENFYYAFECLPPMKSSWTEAGHFFFIPEPITANIYAAYILIKRNGKEEFFTASRRSSQSPASLFNELKNQLGEL